MIADERTAFTASSEVAAEVKVIFASVKRIGISTTVFNNLDDHVATDTATVAMVHTHGRMTNNDRKKLAEYLEARLSISKIEIVDIQ